MHKKLLLLFIGMIATYNAPAQDQRGDHDITVGYGILPAIQVFKGTEFLLTWGTSTNYKNTSVTGEYFIKYQYHLTKQLSVSLYGGKEQESGVWIYIDKENNSRPSDWNIYPVGTFSRTSWTAASELNINYYISKYINVYSTLGVSREFIFEKNDYNLNHPDSIVKNNATYISMYYSPIGVRFGGRICGNIEIGMGYKGIINCGLTYKFLRSKKLKTEQ